MDRIDDEDDRVSSLELGRIAELFDDEQRYPLTTEAVLEEYGDCEIGYPQGEERLADVLTTTGAETYETPDDLELAIMNGVSRDAVGRQRYSDRGDEQAEATDRSERSL